MKEHDKEHITPAQKTDVTHDEPMKVAAHFIKNLMKKLGEKFEESKQQYNLKISLAEKKAEVLNIKNKEQTEALQNALAEIALLENTLLQYVEQAKDEKKQYEALFSFTKDMCDAHLGEIKEITKKLHKLEKENSELRELLKKQEIVLENQAKEICSQKLVTIKQKAIIE